MSISQNVILHIFSLFRHVFMHGYRKSQIKHVILQKKCGKIRLGNTIFSCSFAPFLQITFCTVSCLAHRVMNYYLFRTPSIYFTEIFASCLIQIHKYYSWDPRNSFFKSDFFKSEKERLNQFHCQAPSRYHSNQFQTGCAIEWKIVSFIKSPQYGAKLFWKSHQSYFLFMYLIATKIRYLRFVFFNTVGMYIFLIQYVLYPT